MRVGRAEVLSGVDEELGGCGGHDQHGFFFGQFEPLRERQVSLVENNGDRRESELLTTRRCPRLTVLLGVAFTVLAFELLAKRSSNVESEKVLKAR